MAKRKINYNLAKQAAGNAALTEQMISPTSHPKDSIRDIPIFELITNPYQPRIDIEEQQLKELALSIETEGLLQPILVTTDLKKGFIILAGHRRVEAHKLLEKEYIKAVVLPNVSHEQLAIIPIIENLQRDDMDPIENAIAFKRILDEKIFSSQLELANKISVSKSWMSRILSIIKLPEELLKTIREDKFKDINILTALNTLDNSKTISVYHAVKDMTRADALQYISAIKKKNDIPVTKEKIVVTKNKITINTKNIDKETEKEIRVLVSQIEKLLQ